MTAIHIWVLVALVAWATVATFGGIWAWGELHTERQLHEMHIADLEQRWRARHRREMGAFLMRQIRQTDPQEEGD